MPTKVINNGKLIVYDDVLSEEECNWLINIIDHSSTFQIKSGGRHVTNCELPELSKIMQERCNTWIPPYVYRHSKLKYTSDPHNTDYFYWVSPQVHHKWALVKNPAGGSLSMHLDGSTIYSVDNMSFYTVLCYLNDSDGGTLFEYNKKIEAKRGRVVILDQRLLHQGEITSGDKYIARSEILYTRSKPVSTSTDEIAVNLFNSGEPDAAMNLSKTLEEMLLEF